MRRKRFSTVLGLMLSIAMLAGIVVSSAAAADFEVLNPLGEIEPIANQPLAARLNSDFAGKNIGLVFYAKNQSPHAVRAIGEMLYLDNTTMRGQLRNIGISFGAKTANYYETLATYDAVVLGVADCTLSAWWAAYHAKMIESLGKPVVVLVHAGFVKALKAGALDNGFTGVRYAVIDPGFYSAGFTQMTATGNANYLRQTAFVTPTERVPVTVYDQVKAALLNELTEAEIDPPAITALQLAGWDSGDPTAKTISFAAANEVRAASEFNKLSMELGFGDGLPVIMPLPELVEDMLAATTRDRNDVLGKVMPRGGIITVEKVAINSVMAGARPEYFPVVLAAMEAYASSWEDGNVLYHSLTSSDNYTMMVLVSGPMVEELGLSGQWGYLGSGNEANNGIGRAVRLSIRNIGQTRTHVTDGTARVGRQNDQALTVFGEEKVLLPAGWERHSELMGFGANQSTVTLHGYYAPRMYGNSGGVNAAFTPSSLVSSLRTAAGTNNVSIVTIPRNVADLLRDSGRTSKANLLSNNQMANTTNYRYKVWPVVVGDPDGVRVYAGHAAQSTASAPTGTTAFYTTQAFQTRLITGARLTEAGRDATTPGAPQDFTVTRNGTTATLTWNVPANNGGGTITGYQVSRTSGSAAGANNPRGVIPSGVAATTMSNPAGYTGTTTAIPAAPVSTWGTAPATVPAWTNVPVEEMSYTFEGLDVNTEYYFKVRAINDVRNAFQVGGPAATPASHTSDFSASGRGAWASAPVSLP